MRNIRVTLLRVFAALLALALAACAAPLAALPPTGSAPVKADPSNPGRAVLIQFSGGTETDQIQLIDLKTGQPAEDVSPAVVGTQVSYAYSPDRTHLAVASKGAGCAGMCLRLFDLATLQSASIVDLPEMKYTTDSVNEIIFAPSGDRLAFTYVEKGRGRLALVDLSARGSPSLRSIDFPYTPNRMAFTARGNEIMMAAHPYGETLYASPEIKPHFFALLLDAHSLGITWSRELVEVKDGFYGLPNHMSVEESYIYQPALAVDLARERLYIAHADADRLTTVDFGRRTVSTVEIRDQRAWLEGLVERVLSLGARPVQAKAGNTFIRQGLLSPDGRVLHLIGQRTTMTKTNDNEYETTSTALGLEAWEVDTGLRRLHLDSQASEIRPGLDGEIMLGGYDQHAAYYKPYTQVFDPALGRITATVDEAYAYAAFNTAGQMVLVSSYSNDTGNTYLSFYQNGLTGPHLWQRTLEDGYAFFPEAR